MANIALLITLLVAVARVTSSLRLERHKIKTAHALEPKTWFPDDTGFRARSIDNPVDELLNVANEELHGAAVLNARPIIGILTQPGSHANLSLIIRALKVKLTCRRRGG